MRWVHHGAQSRRACDAASPGDTILLFPDHLEERVVLTPAHRDITIVGSGPETTTWSGGGLGTPLSTAASNLTVHGIRFSDCAESFSTNGLLSNTGIITVIDCLFTNCSAIPTVHNAGTMFCVASTVTRIWTRGSPFVNEGLLEAALCNFLMCSAEGPPLSNSGTAHVARCSFRDNVGSDAAGGIVNRGFLTLSDSVLQGNSGRHGAIYNAGTAMVSRTTFVDNVAEGAFFSEPVSTLVNDYGATMALINCTVSDNSCSFRLGIPSCGATIGNGGHLSISHCTIVSNTTAADLSMTPFASSNAVISIKNSVLDSCNGNVNSHGYNIIADTNLCTILGAASGDQYGVSALLLPLEENSGTFLHPLHIDSPAIDAGTCTNISGDPVLTDQRKMVRPLDGNGDTIAACDIGAYEYDATTSDHDQDGMPDQWEYDHMLNPRDPGDATSDTDGDMANSLEEYVADTNPSDANSFFHIRSIAPSNTLGLWQVTIPTSSNRIYHSEYGLTPNVWFRNPLHDPVTGTGYSMSLPAGFASDPPPYGPPSSLFFRAVVNLPEP